MAKVKADHKDNLRNLSRREFFKRAGISVGTLGSVVGINYLASLYTGSSMEEKQIARVKESRRVTESSRNDGSGYDQLKVRHFAEQICYVSSQMHKDCDLGNPATFGYLILGYLAGDFLGGLALRKLSKKANSWIGSGSYLAGRVVDLLSTYAFAKVMHDPRFTEYGLDAYFAEVNPLVSGIPTTEELAVVGTATSLLGGLACYFLPNIGRGYLGASPFIASHNLDGRIQLISTIKIGDKVDEMIKQKKPVDEIKMFLSTVTSDSL